MTFREAMAEFIIGKKVVEWVSYPPYGDYSKPPEERFYGDGIKVDDGCKYISFGGGCSGEDCNTSYILSPDDKILATLNW